MTIQPSASAAERLSQFFEYIWGDVDGLVYVPTKDATNKWHKTYFPWPLFKESVVQHVLLNSADKDVYYSPALYKNTPEVIAKIKAKEPTSKEDILGSNVAWVEFDGNAPNEWTDLVREAAGGRSERLPGPSLRVQSSKPGNQHVYWKLKEFTSDISFIETINRTVAYMVKADTSGWDINQVLRPIETQNHKPGYGTDNKVFVYDQSNAEYPSSSFSHFEPVREYINESLNEDEIPDPLQVIAKYSWATDDAELLNKSLEELNARDRSGALMRIGFLGAEKGLSDEEIYSLLLFCDEKWGKYKDRHNRKSALVTIINRARQKYPHAKEDVTFAGLVGTNTETEVQPKLVYGFNELLATNIHIDWMIDGLIPAQGLGMIASAPGVGKTQFTMGLGMACAIGKPMLSYAPTRKHKVLFVSLEMNLPSLKYFADTMAPAYNEQEREDLQRNFLMFPWGMPIDFMKEESRKGFESIVESERPEGIYIDSLQKIYLGDLSKDEIRGVYTYLSYLRQKFNLYVWLIHHDRKATEGNKRPRDLSDIYGSTYITAEPDSVLHLWRSNPSSNIIELRPLKMRLSATPEPIHITRNQHLGFQVATEQEESEANFSGLQPSSNTRSEDSFNPFK